MKLLTMMILFGLLCWTPAGSHARPSPTDAHMTSEERDKVVKMLLDTQRELLDATENVSDAQWSWHPAPFRWSVGQTAEHIMLAEGLIFNAVQSAVAQKPNPDWESRTATKLDFLERALPNRDRHASAPDIIQPSGKLSKAEVLTRFKEARARTLKFAQETDIALKEHTLEHPFPIFGTLNAYDWLIYIPLHNIRHNQQLAAVKASAGFPQK
jgi:hypothetical protein